MPKESRGAALLPRRLAGLAQLLFPHGCAACGAPAAEGTLLCPMCRAGVRPLDGPVCRLCGDPLGQGDGRLCPECRAQPPNFDWARSLAVHTGPLADMVRDYKYRRRLALGKALGGCAEQLWRELDFPPVDLVAPVPLHRLRLLNRGFNQALALARPLAAKTGAALAPRLLKRTRYTRPQVGLSAKERAANVAGAFATGPGWRTAHDGARVLLVDDVFTSGATLDHCAAALKAAGAARVFAFTLLRTA